MCQYQTLITNHGVLGRAGSCRMCDFTVVVVLNKRHVHSALRMLPNNVAAGRCCLQCWLRFKAAVLLRVSVSTMHPKFVAFTETGFSYKTLQKLLSILHTFIPQHVLNWIVVC